MIVDMTNVDVVIGIDPDNAKSGVGIVHKATAEVQTQTATFSELLSLLKDKQETGTRFGVVIEGGWLTTSNWHTTSVSVSAMQPFFLSLCLLPLLQHY